MRHSIYCLLSTQTDTKIQKIRSKKMEYLNIEDVEIIYRNFAGRDTKYTKGERSIVIDVTDNVELYRNIGVNIQEITNDSNNTVRCGVQVKIKTDNVLPTIYTVIDGIKSRCTDVLDINNIDNLDITTADLVVRPYHYDVAGRTGTALYLKIGYFVCENIDPYADKYQ